MKLLRSPAFARSLKKTIKKNTHVADDIRDALRLLEADLFDPRLKTHKLKGTLGGSMAASAGYDLRIIFSVVSVDGESAIMLQTLGTHDEVY